jgi:hypothetical protein
MSVDKVGIFPQKSLTPRFCTKDIGIANSNVLL